MRLSLVQRLENAHEDSLWTAAWASNVNLLVTGSVDETVKLWKEDGDVLEQRHALSGVTLGAVSVAVDATGTVGAVCALDSSISVWSMEDYSPVGPSIPTAPSATWGIAFLPRGSKDAPLLLAMAGGSSNTVKIWDVSTGKELVSMAMPSEDEKHREKFVLSVSVSGDGTKIVAGAMDGSVAMFDAGSGSLIHRLKGHFKPVRSVSFTPDGKYVLTASNDMNVGIFNANDGSLVEMLSGHESWVLSVAPHPDGSAIATSGADGKVRLWDMTSRTCAQTLTEHMDRVWDVAWRPDGARLASVSEDKSICLWDFS